MKSERSFLPTACLLTLLVFLLPMVAVAQSTDDSKSKSDDNENTHFGDYIVTQSLEFGYRSTNLGGAKFPCAVGSKDRSSAGFCQDSSMYNTFVNLHTGPRLLEQTLSLRSPGQKGVLFDNLFLNSFGWGGDPNNVARLRVSKAKVYNLVVNFRRDQNFFNYDLLANPLNPGTLNSSSSVFFSPGNVSLTPGTATNQFLVSNSPHWFSSTRKLTDVDLTIAPQSAISLRLGYSRVRTDGLNGWTYHMSHGTDINPTETQDNTSDLYRVGIDFKFLPKTTISYDQFYNHNRVGIGGLDLNQFFVVGGQPSDLGISWNISANQPCSAANFPTRCNQALSFLLSNQSRSSTPTEQLSFQSHPSKRIDLSGRAMYTHTHQDGNWRQFWTGLAGTPGSASAVGNGLLLTSLSHNKRDEAAADLGLTIHLTEKIRLLDTFRWYNWRVSTDGLLNGTAFNPGAASKAITGPIVFTTSAPSGITGCTVFPCIFPEFFKEERKENEVSVEFDVTHAVGARVGYRYTDRFIFDADEVIPATSEGAPASGDIETGQDRASVTGHTGLAGFWIRPNEKFRFSADGELTYNKQLTGGGDTGIDPNTTFGLGPLTRITPRHEQQYRVRANYTPQRQVVFSASLNYNQASNKLATDNFDFHNYNAGAAVIVMPSDRITFDLSYNYNSYLQNDLICPIGAVSGVPLPFGGTILNTVCPFDVGTNGLPTGLYQTLGRFDNVNQFASALIRVKPVTRLAVSLGYSITNSDGSQLFTNSLLVPGSLKNTFHRPLADIEIGLTRKVFAKAGWNYYGYNEKAFAGQSLPRDFHANTGTFSLRYAF